MGNVIGVDIGGTFTDCIVIDDSGTITIGKALSTGPKFHEGFLASMGAAGEKIGVSLEQLVSNATGIYHGCTVGTNAMVEGRTASVGLLTTRGHRDVLATMRAGRRLWNQSPEYIAHLAGQGKPAALVPKRRIAEIDERVGSDGQVIVELDDDRARAAIRELLQSGADAIAVSLLWSIANDVHERRLAELVQQIAPGMFISVASAIIRRTGEYERTVATVVNSLIGPIMNSYIEQVERELKKLGYARALQIMTCSGGVVAASQAREFPLLTIGSGPVGGLIGAGALGSAGKTVVSGGLGESTAKSNGSGPSGGIITADMGGTTLDVGVIRNGQALTRSSSWHGQYEYFVPTLDVRSIGAGGGSIIHYDEDMGSLRVGPQSAGSNPGPACYRRGGQQATVTDADVLLGYVNPDNFLGGEMSLDVAAARAALEQSGRPLGLNAEETALAAIQIVENQMADAIRLASVQQGYDPRPFVLFAYGGAGPLHGAALARELKIGRVVVPLSNLAAGWSAFGVASADVLVVEEVAVGLVSPFDPEGLNESWRQLEAAVYERMAAQDIKPGDVALQRFADMRYSRQVNEVQVVAPSGDYDHSTVDELVDGFEREYTRLFGEDTGYAPAGFTVTGLRIRGNARMGNYVIQSRDGGGGSAEADPSGERGVLFSDGVGRVTIPVYDGSALKINASLQGPAIIEFPDTSVVVHADTRATVDSFGSVLIEL